VAGPLARLQELQLLTELPPEVKVEPSALGEQGPRVLVRAANSGRPPGPLGRTVT
jgi:hypothetical protein